MSRQWGKALSRNQAMCARHNRVALCCVMTEKAMHTQQTRPSAYVCDRLGRASTTRLVHQGWARTIEVYRDKLLTVVKKKEKKKTPWDWGITKVTLDEQEKFTYISSLMFDEEREQLQLVLLNNIDVFT